MTLDDLASLDPKHLAALTWFHERAGQDVGWPEPLDGLFLVNKAKGIHKPQGLEYALSIRQSMDGPYEDALNWAADGSWQLRYHHEGSDPSYFTNRAMNACRLASVPVGVLLQVKQKPNPMYRVLGLGLITEDRDGAFTLRQYATVAERSEASIAVQLPTNAFDSSNVADARHRAMKAIAIRRGQPAFRRSLVQAYGGACSLSGCTTGAVLEAAHISPYRGEHTNHVTNGLLLRADLHTLFDLGLVRIEPGTYTVIVANDLDDPAYREFHGRRMRLPADPRCWPDEGALRAKYLVGE